MLLEIKKITVLPGQKILLHEISWSDFKAILELAIDPPPDLALEIEITSGSNINIYQALKVTELWKFEQSKL